MHKDFRWRQFVSCCSDFYKDSSSPNSEGSIRFICGKMVDFELDLIVVNHLISTQPGSKIIAILSLSFLGCVYIFSPKLMSIDGNLPYETVVFSTISLLNFNVVVYGFPLCPWPLAQAISGKCKLMGNGI